jgi:hypothetical protein
LTVLLHRPTKTSANMGPTIIPIILKNHKKLSREYTKKYDTTTTKLFTKIQVQHKQL